MRYALVRQLSANMGACELSFVARVAIDMELAHAQHRAYQRALTELGCQVIELAAEHQLPDAVFVEDTALVLDELAVMTRPGAPSRRAECPSVATVLARYRRLLEIQAPGTLDGGDILRLGRQIFVGASARSNASAHEQLRAALADYGYQVTALPIRGCLHLKSAVTEVAEQTLLINPDWIDVAHFSGYRLIEVDPLEPHAANALRVGDGLIYPSGFPRTTARLQAAGINCLSVDVSELQKAEGAVTCCSLLFSA